VVAFSDGKPDSTPASAGAGIFLKMLWIAQEATLYAKHGRRATPSSPAMRTTARWIGGHGGRIWTRRRRLTFLRSLGADDGSQCTRCGSDGRRQESWLLQ